MGPNRHCDCCNHFYEFDQIYSSLKYRITCLMLKVVMFSPRKHIGELGQSKPVVGAMQPTESDATRFAASNDACGSPAAQYGVTAPILRFL